VKSLYIKELNKSFVLLNKSGSLLLLNTLMDFSKYKGYHVTEQVNVDSEVFIFVRNPIERIKTCFTWFLSPEGKRDNQNYEDLCLKIFNQNSTEITVTLDNFMKFISAQHELYKLNNSHFLPQKVDLLNNKFVDTLTGGIVKAKYPNHHFVQIEKFGDLIINSINHENDDLLMNYGDKKTNHKIIIDYFLLNTFNSDDLLLFSALFLYNKKVLDSKHHTNKMIDLPENIESKLYFLLQDEYDLYGYLIKRYFYSYGNESRFKRFV
jgi:hypothetical protein